MLFVAITERIISITVRTVALRVKIIAIRVRVLFTPRVRTIATTAPIGCMGPRPRRCGPKVALPRVWCNAASTDGRIVPWQIPNYDECFQGF